MVTTAVTDRRSVSVGVTFGIILVAFVVFMQAGANQSLGPLDVGTADLLALALWVAAPIAGGLADRGCPNRALTRAAITVGLVVGLVVALFPLAGTGDYTCWLSLPSGPLASVVGRLVVGGLVGTGIAFALFATGVAARNLGTAVPGVALAGAVNLGASVAAYQLFYGAVRCL